MTVPHRSDAEYTKVMRVADFAQNRVGTRSTGVSGNTRLLRRPLAKLSLQPKYLNAIWTPMETQNEAICMHEMQPGLVEDALCQVL
jgi:hypothetical protein